MAGAPYSQLLGFFMSDRYHDHPKECYLKVPAGFVAQGTSLNAWCQTSGLHIQNVRDASLGKWNGPSSDALRKRVVTASGASIE